MLKDWSRPEKPEKDEIDKRYRDAVAKLEIQQLLIKEKKLPVFVLFDGYDSSGKGSVLGQLIKNIDPRFFKVFTNGTPSPEDLRKPFLYRHFVKIPVAGKFTFLDEGWLSELSSDYLTGKTDDDMYKKRVDSIKRFERQLTDNGYLVVKFFFHIKEKEQKQRFKQLLDDKNAAWRVTEHDIWQNKHYKEYTEVYDKCLSDTQQPCAPWYLIDAQDKKWALLQVMEFLVQGIDTALKNSALSVPLLQNIFPLKKMSKLKDISLDKTISEKEYKEQLKKYQDRLHQLHNEIYLKKIPVIIAYEGWDAAGKGGNIKRITEALDPRGYEVHPIASPEPHEKARHYLWRFWSRLPKTGHIAIFDRTWYGRVMVERLEGFCGENDWQRAYNEINEFEKELYDWNAVIIKFWVQIDKETQLERFNERQNTPEKQWKITDEDWRNREKWDLYETAVNEMLKKTSTTFAPWHILESNDKKYARIKALKIVIRELEKKLKEIE